MVALSRKIRVRLPRAAAFALALGLAGAVTTLVPKMLEFDESVGLAALFALRGAVPPPADVAVISISGDSADAVNQSSELDEWPRTLHAELIDKLVAAHAAVIVFDVSFDEPRTPAEDDALAAAVQGAGNVILLEKLETKDLPGASGVVERRVPPIAKIKNGALAAAPFTLPVVPIRVGQFWTFDRTGGDQPTLPVAALQAYLLPHRDEFAALLESVRPGVTAQWPKAPTTAGLEVLVRAVRGAFQRDATLAAEAIRALRSRAVPDKSAMAVLLDVYGGRDSRYLNFHGPARTIATIPYDRVLREPDAVDVAGKVLFVGFSERRQPEQQDTFYSVFSLRTGINLSGVEIGATAFANMLQQRSLEPLSMPAHALLVLGWGVVFGLVLGVLSTRRALAVAVLAGAGYFGFAYWQFVAHSAWWPLFVPLALQLPAAFLAAWVGNYRLLSRQRLRVQTALGYYAPGVAIDDLAERSIDLDANRQLLHGTCLFTDAEDYTTVAEALRPDQLRELLNDYYEVMFGAVARHGGLVSDTAGDSMVAIWAAATPNPATRLGACRAAFEITDAIAEFNRQASRRPLPTRIGLASGEILLGNVGAEERFEYRAIGDIVNTASRLQGLNRVLGTRVLVSDATLVGVEGLRARDLGWFLLRGKVTPVHVHEPLGLGALPEGQDALVDAFAAALEAFTARQWTEANGAFATVLERFPNDGPSRFYRDLSAELERRPDTWAGAVVVTSK